MAIRGSGAHPPLKRDSGRTQVGLPVAVAIDARRAGRPRIARLQVGGSLVGEPSRAGAMVKRN